RAGAGHRPPQAVRWSSLIFLLLVSYPGVAHRLAQVLLCNSPQEAAPENDEAQSRRWADRPRGSAAADVAGSVHFQPAWWCGSFVDRCPAQSPTVAALGSSRLIVAGWVRR